MAGPRATIVSRGAGYARRMSSWTKRALVGLLLAAAAPSALVAQGVRDSVVVTPPRVATRVPQAPSRLAPPLTPRRAFLYSLMLPGLGQSRLDRGTSGALFASVELAAIAMVRRSASDLREARRYGGDTLPSDFIVTGTTLTKTGTVTGRYGVDLERARRLHVEDWLAVIAFNHLFSGADAFVSAQLWDVPVSLSAVPVTGGAMMIATLRW